MSFHFIKSKLRKKRNNSLPDVVATEHSSLPGTVATRRHSSFLADDDNNLAPASDLSASGESSKSKNDSILPISVNQPAISDKDQTVGSYDDFISFLDNDNGLEETTFAGIETVSNGPYWTEEDDTTRHLGVPVSNVIQRAEQESLESGNENKGFLSFRNGFLPMLYPEEKLPEKFKVWDDMGKNLHRMMSDLSLRPFVDNELEVLTATSDELNDRYLFRAALVLGMTAHGYYYCGPKEPKSLPPSLKVPWDEVNRRLGRKGSYLSGEDVQLYNFHYKMAQQQKVKSGSVYDSQSSSFIIENLNMLQPLWNNKAEIIFHLAFCEMAKAAAPLLRLIAHAQDAVQREDDQKMLATIQSITVCIEDIQRAFMKIIPDPNAKLGIEPLVWAKTVAPVGVSFNKGMPSPSGLGTPFFHCLDMFFSRGKYSSTLGKDSIGAREFFPKNWLDVLNAISHISVHVYVSSSDNEELHNAWSHAIDVYASWNGLLGKHLQKTYNFLELAFKTGREKTLGGFQGGFSDRMWDKIMDMLDVSRKERLMAKNATLKLPQASLKSVEGDGDIKTLVYMLPHDAFVWQPGDTVSVWPSNSTEMTLRVLTSLGATGDELVELSEEWRIHLKQFIHLPMKVGKRSQQAPLRHVIQFAQLSPVPDETLNYLSTLLPAFAHYNNDDTTLDLPMLLGALEVLYADNVFHIDENGTMPGLKLNDPETLYSQLLRNGAEPLVEDIVAILHSIGINDIPLFTNRFIDFQTFKVKVFPIFVENLKRNLGERSAATAVDIFRPIKPRQYSIANRMDGSKHLKLIVKHLSYSKKATKGDPGSSVDWRSHNRQVRLAQKYFRLWKKKALQKKLECNLKSSTSRASQLFLDIVSSDFLPNSDSTRAVNGVASHYLCSTLGDLIFTIQSNPGFHAPPTSKPLVMVAASSGISPFMGFLEDRIAANSSAKTLLFWTIPYIKEGMHVLKDLEHMLEGSKAEVDIFVNVTRESICPVFKDGKFILASRPRQRVTEYIERNPSLRKQLHELLIPEKYHGKGGFTYLCGSARFVESTLDVFSGLLTDMSLFVGNSDARLAVQADSYSKLSKNWLVEEMQSDQKIVYEVFGDGDDKPDDLPKITISELVTKNDLSTKQNNGLWLAIYGKVYDITSFIHPGGERILHSYCGGDCTVAWEAVRHHKSQSLNAKLETLLKGQLIVPTFPPLPLLQLDKTTVTDVNGVFETCRNMIFQLVEIENAMTMEYSLDELHIAGEAQAKELTPMKVQMLFQAHRRFVFSHLLGTLTATMADALKYKNALRYPQSVDLGDDFFRNAPAIKEYTAPDNILQEYAGYEKMVVACDLLVKGCHHPISNGGKSLMGYLANFVYVVKRYDLELIRRCKETMKMLIMYFEERDTQELSLLNLYHEMERVFDIIKLDMKYYTEKWSSESALEEIWDMMDVSQDDLASYSAFNGKHTRLEPSEPHAGWQSGVKK